MSEELIKDTGKTLERLWYENNNHLPMAVMWFSGGYMHDNWGGNACKTEQRQDRDRRALVLRFVRRYLFFGPVTAVVMQHLSQFKNRDGTYNTIGEPFVNHDRWKRACYYHIGSGFYRDSTVEALDLWHHDHEASLQAARGEARFEVEEGKKRDTIG